MPRCAMTLALAGALAACGGSSPAPDSGFDSGFDAFDSSSPDASVPDTSVPDSGTDAPIVDAAIDTATDTPVVDAGCMCPEPTGCLTFECIDGACVEMPVLDGTECGEMASVCVAGTCTPRGCGDGFRELGPAPARESCDDGNLDDGDACTSMCVSQSVVAAFDPGGDWTPSAARRAPVVGVDGEGRVLVVYSEDEAATLPIMGQRFSPVGTAVGTPFLIESMRGVATLVGLRGGGWVVSYGQSGEVVARVISVDEASPEVSNVGPVRILNASRDGTQGDPRLASLGDGFVAVWFDGFDSFEDRDGGSYARRFSATASPLDAADIRIATDTAGVQRNARIASDGERWLVTFENGFFHELLASTLMGRRFDGATPVDSEPFVIAPVESRNASATGLSMPFDEAARGEFAVAFDRVPTSTTIDIYVRLVTTGAPATFPPEMLWANDVARDTNPTIAALPSTVPDVEFVIGWELLGGDADLIATRALPPELETLRTELERFRRHFSVVASPNGTWVSWVSSPFLTDSLHLFLLPHD